MLEQFQSLTQAEEAKLTSLENKISYYCSVKVEDSVISTLVPQINLFGSLQTVGVILKESTAAVYHFGAYFYGFGAILYCFGCKRSVLAPKLDPCAGFFN